MAFDKNNWNYCQYKFGENKAIISFGAAPSNDDVKFQYFVTVLDSENNELQQSQYDDIDIACQFINKQYTNIAEFIDLSDKKDSGCDSCAAH